MLIGLVTKNGILIVEFVNQKLERRPAHARRPSWKARSRASGPS